MWAEGLDHIYAWFYSISCSNTNSNKRDHTWLKYCSNQKPNWEQQSNSFPKKPFICMPAEIDGETVETVSDFIFGAPKSLQMVTAAMKLKDAYSVEGKLWPI